MSQKKSWDPIDAISVLLTHVAFWSVLALTLIIASAISLVFVDGAGWQILAACAPIAVVIVAAELADNWIHACFYNHIAARCGRTTTTSSQGEQ